MSFLLRSLRSAVGFASAPSSSSPAIGSSSRSAALSNAAPSSQRRHVSLVSAGSVRSTKGARKAVSPLVLSLMERLAKRRWRRQGCRATALLWSSDLQRSSVVVLGVASEPWLPSSESAALMILSAFFLICASLSRHCCTLCPGPTGALLPPGLDARLVFSVTLTLPADPRRSR